MKYIAETQHNPFDVRPPCEQFVPGFGDPNAHFHVVGDHPGVHGGLGTGIPFTDHPWSDRFFDTLQRGGLVQAYDLTAGTVDCRGTFFSYLCMCAPGSESASESEPAPGSASTSVSDGESTLTTEEFATPTDDEYVTMEPYFDAELRAITAHVLLPVGERATAHVLESYTARAVDGDLDMDSFHASDLRGSGWLVIPLKDPSEWSERDGGTLADALADLLDSDYRQISDLGRFLPGEDPYFVR